MQVRGEGSGRLRLKALPDAGQETLTSWVKESVEPGAIVHTDGWAGYGMLASAGFGHGPAPSGVIIPTPRSSCRAPAAATAGTLALGGPFMRTYREIVEYEDRAAA